MKRIATLFLSAFALFLIAGGVAQAAYDNSLQSVRTKISEMFTEIDPENINDSPIEGWYTIHKGPVIAYVSADGRYLLQGDLIDLDEQVNLSEVTRTDARRAMMSKVNDDQSITFSPVDVKHRVTIFTDVDCGYCRKLHSQIDEYLAAGIEVRYLLYPRNGPSSPSWGVSENVWCARDRNSALTAAKLNQQFESNRCDTTAVTQQYMLGQDAGLTGTPAIVFDDGTLISGYLPPAQLSYRLEQANASTN